MEDGGFPDYQIIVQIRSSRATGVTQFSIALDAPGSLTKRGDEDEIIYFSIYRSPLAQITEIALANYDHQLNQYRPSRTVYPPERLFEGQRIPGPILLIEEPDGVTLLAYEHGGDQPNKFLCFELREREILMRALKGNYIKNQPAQHLSPNFLVVHGTSVDEVLTRFRTYLLSAQGPTESRKPYIFYNTWNHQERNKYLRQQPYLSEMNLERMQAEVDVAHEIGIEVFVIDTGWYAKTGDWEVNLERFPDGLASLKAKLDSYGMKLGLWFNPIVAAETSSAYLSHPEWVIEKNGKPNFWGPVWETESSYGMCLCSGWSDHFAETLIRLYRELGVTYFKWDAVGQWGCESANHDHGSPEDSIEERKANYAFESGRRLSAIAEKVVQSCPEAIVDFDVTEGGRYFGLGFLRSGKFFLVNNGPYYANFDIPKEFIREPDTINVFFHPGASRPRVCRGGYRFDPVVPASVFLTHYLPDGGPTSRQNSFASLVLGGNGIWGSLVELTQAERDFWNLELARYKRVREAANRAYPKVTGEPGLSPEIHEKIDGETGEGLVVFFTVTPGEFSYVTQPLTGSPKQVFGADRFERLESDALLITVLLEKDGAAVVTIEA